MMKNNNLRLEVIIILLLLIATNITLVSKAAPSVVVEYKIKAEIINITDKNNSSIYKIQIIESDKINNHVHQGQIIEARKNSVTDVEIGDIINAKLCWQGDEDGEWYWLEDVTVFQSEEEIDLLIILPSIVIIIILFGLVIYLVRKRKFFKDHPSRPRRDN